MSDEAGKPPSGPTPEQILSAARVLVRAVLKSQAPTPEAIEAVARNVAGAIPGYGRAIGKLTGAVPRCTDARLPHWIVKNITPRGPGEFKQRHLFMHPSLELAEAEARRLALAYPGQRFVLYASAGFFREDTPAVQSAPEAAEAGAES